MRKVYGPISQLSRLGRRNYLLMFWDSVIFTNAMTFLSVTVVIPYFLSTLGANTFQIGLASTLVGVGTLITQPFFAKWATETSKKLTTFVWILTVQRVFFLIFVMLMPLLAVRHPGWTVPAFLICWGIYNLFTGSYSPFYVNLFSNMVPGNLRGSLLGFSRAAANIIAIAASYFVGVLLKQLAFPWNYTVVFGIGAILLLVDCLDFWLMKEPPDMQGAVKISYKAYIDIIPQILKTNKFYVKLVLSYVFFTIANISLSFYSLYMIRTYHATAGDISLLMIITGAVNIAGNLFFGVLSDRRGHMLVLKISACLGVVAGICVICFHSILGMYGAFTFSSLCACGYMLSNSVLIMQHSPQQHISIYISINIMITTIVSSLITMLSSAVIDAYSFAPAFIAFTLAALAALIAIPAKGPDTHLTDG